MAFELTKKSILLISPEPWDHLHISKHHYAIELAKLDNNVLFLNPPSGRWFVTSIDIPGVLVIDYKGFFPGLRWMPKKVREFFQRRTLNKIQNLTDTQIDVLWSFDNSTFFDFNTLRIEMFCISHIVDHTTDFQFARAAQSADLCLGVTHGIVERLKKYNPKSYFINHGLALHEPEKFSLDKDRFSIGYSGNIDKPYLDWNLITETIETFADVNFYFAGPMKDNHGLQNCENVKYLGVLSKPQLTWFHSHMDILIIPNLSSLYPEQLSNSHKLLEYLYSGNAVLTTQMQEYTESPLLFMSRNSQEWLEIIKRLLEGGDTNQDMKDQRIQFALNNTYIKQIKRIERIINE